MKNNLNKKKNMKTHRNLDCANDYGNESEIGESLLELIKNNEIKREELFIQAKLWNTNHRTKHIMADLNATLKDLKLEYLDSYVIHWPQAVPSYGQNAALNENGPYPANYKEGTMFPLTDNGYYCTDKDCHYIETWHFMENLIDKGYLFFQKKLYLKI